MKIDGIVKHTFTRSMENGVPGLGVAATAGSIWYIGFAALNKVVTLIGQLALIWLLVPSAMGLAAMAISMASFASFLSPGTLDDVLVQRNRYDKDVGQAMWLAAGIGIAGMLCIGLIAGISVVMGKPEIGGLLSVLALGSLVSGPGSVLGARLKLHLDFKHLAFAHGIQGFVFTSSALTLAWLHFGAYSLVIPVIPSVLASTGYLLWREGWPKFQSLRPAVLKQLGKPMMALALAGSLHALQAQLPIFMTGITLDISSTGHFSWGWMVAGQTVFLLAGNLRHVLLPVFSKMSKDRDRQVNAAIRSAVTMTAVLSLTCGAQALLAGPLIRGFFPDKWHAAVPVVEWVSLGLALQGLTVSSSAWLNATGRYPTLFWVSGASVLFVSGATYFGALLNGLTGAAMGAALGGVSSSALFFICLPLRGKWEQLSPGVMALMKTSLLGISIYLIGINFAMATLQVALAIVFLALGAWIWIGSNPQLSSLFDRFKKDSHD